MSMNSAARRRTSGRRVLGDLQRRVLEPLDVVADDAADGVLGGVRLRPDQVLDLVAEGLVLERRRVGGEDVADGRAVQGGDALAGLAGLGGGLVERLRGAGRSRPGSGRAGRCGG